MDHCTIPLSMLNSATTTSLGFRFNGSTKLVRMCEKKQTTPNGVGGYKGMGMMWDMEVEQTYHYCLILMLNLTLLTLLVGLHVNVVIILNDVVIVEQVIMALWDTSIYYSNTYPLIFVCVCVVVVCGALSGIHLVVTCLNSSLSDQQSSHSLSANRTLRLMFAFFLHGLTTSTLIHSIVVVVVAETETWNRSTAELSRNDTSSALLEWLERTVDSVCGIHTSTNATRAILKRVDDCSVYMSSMQTVFS